MDKKKIIEELINLEIEELYLDIGQELVSDAIKPISNRFLIDVAKRWVSENQQKIKTAICENQRVNDLQEQIEDKEKRILLVTSIADLISGFCTGISPFTVSVIIVKEGLKQFCKE